MYARLSTREGYAEIVRKCVTNGKWFLYFTYSCSTADQYMDGKGHFAECKSMSDDDYYLADEERLQLLRKRLKAARRVYIMELVRHERFLREKKEREAELKRINAERRIAL